MKHRKSSKIAGNILMLLSFAFIADRIIEYGVDFSNISQIRTFIILIVFILICAFLVIAFSLLFYSLLRIFNEKSISNSIKDIIYIYCKSNLYKYLPGNIFHYIGRNEVTFRNEISHGVVISATIAELILLTLGAVITALAFSGLYAVRWALNNSLTQVVAAFLIFIVLVTLAGWVLSRTDSKLTGIWNTKPVSLIRLRDAIILIMVYIISFISNGVMFLFLLQSIGGELSNDLFFPVIGMYTLSWMIGFVTPGAPAGLGIREAIMSALLVGVVEAEFVISAVVIYRIITILGDVVAFIMVHQLSRKGICQRFAPSFIFRLTR